ncbi:MAG: hypothetical protein RJQ03_00800, partial [Miltoncostaeaceae bacterium]
MTAWENLASASGWMRARPLTTWPGPVTPEGERVRSPFSAAWWTTLDLLRRELDHLGAETAVLELAITEADIRLDGLPRAAARAAHPGVVLSFTSTHGPLRYAVDRFRSWQDNLRAISLGLESLRRVDRYGMTRAGEQYRGWVAIEAEAGPADLVDRGRILIADHGSVAAALRATHPDHGGAAEDLRAVLAARDAEL